MKILRHFFNLDNDSCLFILYGGLGNQLYQYTFSKYFEKKYKKKIYYFDSSKIYKIDRLYGSEVFHDIDLKKLFDFNINYINSKKTIKPPLNSFLFSFILRLSLYIHNRIGFGLSKIIIHDNNLKLKDIEKKIYSSSFLIFHGYWQQIFSEYEANFYVSNFKFKKSLKIPKELENFYKRKNIALHIRRGNFINTKKGPILHGSVPIKYYLNSISLLRSKLGDLKIIIFTDDKEWFQNNLKNKITNYVLFDEKYRSYSNDFFLMSKCDHFILSNSTFAWWAAYIARLKNNKSIVVLPKFYNRSVIENYRIPYDKDYFIVDSK